MSLVLSQNTDLSVKDLAGVHIKWTSTLENPIQELDLIIFDIVANSSNKVSLNTKATTADVSPDLLIAGRQFTFYLYAVDTNGVAFTSNIFKPTAPYTLSAPTIISATGVSNGVNLSVTFPALKNGESLSGNPKVTFVFLEISSGVDQIPFTVDFPYGQSSYLVDSTKNATMANDNLYKVSCFIKPDPADTTHPSQSAISNTVDANPSNLPQAPTILTVGATNVASGNTPLQDAPATANWSFSWTAPADLPYWSRFNNSKVQVQIFVRKENAYLATPDVVLNNPQTLTYTFTGGDIFNNGVSVTQAGQGVAFKIKYVNDSGEGAFSNEAFYYNNQNLLPPTSLTAVVDPSNTVVNLAWNDIPNLALANDPYQWKLTQSKGGVETVKLLDYATSPKSYTFSFSPSDIGTPLFYTLAVTSKWKNDVSVALTSRTVSSGSVSLYINPTALTNCSAVGGDRKITFSWSVPAVLDGDDHTLNEAVIVVTQVDTGFSNQYNGTGGSFILEGLTNGLIYSADFFAVGTTPLGVKKTGSSKITKTNIVPKGGLLQPTNIQAVGGDRNVTVSWKEKVGDVVNGNKITGFKVAIPGLQGGWIYAGLVVTTNPTTLDTAYGNPWAVNGETYEFWVGTIYESGESEYVKQIFFTPFGLPTVSNIQHNGRTITCDFSPNGRVLSGFDIIGLPAVPKITDQLLLQSPADMSGYSRAIKGSVPLTFTFSGASSDVIASILVLGTQAGTVVGKKGIAYI